MPSTPVDSYRLFRQRGVLEEIDSDKGPIGYRFVTTSANSKTGSSSGPEGNGGSENFLEGFGLTRRANHLLIPGSPAGNDETLFAWTEESPSGSNISVEMMCAGDGHAAGEVTIQKKHVKMSPERGKLILSDGASTETRGVPEVPLEEYLCGRRSFTGETLKAKDSLVYDVSTGHDFPITVYRGERPLKRWGPKQTSPFIAAAEVLCDHFTNEYDRKDNKLSTCDQECPVVHEVLYARPTAEVYQERMNSSMYGTGRLMDGALHAQPLNSLDKTVQRKVRSITVSA